MDANTIHILDQLTTDFYARCAKSFSATRHHAWEGWRRLVHLPIFSSLGSSFDLLDIGCGNLRFETFLSRNVKSEMLVWAVDNCPALLPHGTSVRFQELNIVSELIDDTLNADLEAPLCEFVCSFGLFHHIPDTDLRKRLLDTMVERAKPHGIIALSLWRFEEDERLLAKAKHATKRALEAYPSLRLEAHDWLLDWQRQPGVFRYCHSFCDEEVDELVQHVSSEAALVDSFHADGRNNDLNRYLVFERNA